MAAQNRSPSRRWKNTVLVVLSGVLLFLEFNTNAWKVVGSEWFWTHQRSTESFVVARMVLSRQGGIFSEAGLPGLGSLDSSPPSYAAIPARDQYRAYIKGLRFERYSPYKSQVGGQGILFSSLDRLIPSSPRTKLSLFHGFNSFLSAVVLAFIILWFFKEFGLLPAVFVLVSTVASQWLVVFARNLWWSVWAFYLPMLVVMSYLRRRPVPSARQAWTLGGLLAASLFAKCLFNGYEFLTTTLLMAVVPLAYYSVRDRWAVGHLLRYGLAASLAAVLAVALSLGILLAQIGSLKEDAGNGGHYILWTMKKRTHGNSRDFPTVYAASLKSGTLSVVLSYIKGPFLSSHDFMPAESSGSTPSRFQISYASLLALFAAASVLLLLRRKASAFPLRPRAGPALLAATWFSLLAPLSWFVLFKAHSYIHTHMNFLVWQMPFTLFGFALCGFALRSFLKMGKNSPLLHPGGPR